MVSSHYLALFPLLFIIFLVVPMRRRSRLLKPLPLLDEIPAHRFLGLELYLKDNGESMPCEQFWRQSNGLAGVATRIRHMVVIVRLLQHQIRSGRVTRRDAGYVWQQALLQTWFSLWSLPEAGMCALWARIPHACGLFALRCHYQLSVATVTLCGSEDALDGMESLSQLL